jgi:hypothetical protein
MSILHAVQRYSPRSPLFLRTSLVSIIQLLLYIRERSTHIPSRIRFREINELRVERADTDRARIPHSQSIFIAYDALWFCERACQSLAPYDIKADVIEVAFDTAVLGAQIGQRIQTHLGHAKEPYIVNCTTKLQIFDVPLSVREETSQGSSRPVQAPQPELCHRAFQRKHCPTERSRK